MSLRSSASLAAVGILAACGTPQAATPSPSPTPTPEVSASPTREALPAGAIRFAILATRSVATIRVRESIVAIPAPGDAVVTSTAFAGSLVLFADGTFARGSSVSVDLDALRSDSDLRDEWIKINTLQTRIYPRAEFTPARVAGVPLPLPASGEWAASIEGTMKIHGVERPLVWEVKVTRSAGEVRARGTTAFKFGDYGMAVPANRLVLSVVDDVRLEIDLVGRED